MDIVQARTSLQVKTQANDILEKLGLNMSSYINMALNQLIIQGGIPFEVKLKNKAYSNEQTLEELKTTFSMENMELDSSDVEMINNINNGSITPEEARKKILSEI